MGASIGMCLPDASPGSEILAMVRPEDVVLRSADSAEPVASDSGVDRDNWLKGEVLEVQYFGDAMRVSMKVQDQEIIAKWPARHANEPPQPGAMAQVSWSPSSCVPLGGDARQHQLR